ncbi:armadillo-type protein [Staphylotrichum tortipilum]|uniref:Nucleolar protein 9 n=1 Tax=Staphylotrichum tortipilum TaxID=2831512 RepID=A0AAN6RSB2_9PEZI|nr:armadillo-type protein [Staphylotrichum longicolle]
MGKNRKSKRQLVRDEKRAKKRDRELADGEERAAKRQRNGDDDHGDDNDNDYDYQQQSNNDLFTLDPNADFIPLDDGDQQPLARPRARGGNFEREFFGMLADQEQEYFRHADELLELNDFPSPEDRYIFLQSVYREARGKELKLASSQSCSRLMERLILLSNPCQKKSLFGAFAGHFMTLVTHRFAGHCCEKLFLLSAPVVTEELSGEADKDVEMAEAGEEDAEEREEVATAMKTPMEDLLMLTLDEFEEHLSFLLSDRYGSHALRVLLVVLSGRPLDQAGTKSLLQGKNKEHITVEGAAANASALISQTRTVPSSFSAAIEKIIVDSTATLDATALRVLAKHPTGNPTLQLLLELELAMSSKAKKGAKAQKEKEEEAPAEGGAVSLLERLVPDAPVSFADEKSQACEFVNSMLYDPIGSRLLETLIAHCPGKIFKGLLANIFGPRIQSLLRNDIASYPAIKVLNRLSKEDLADAVQKSLPEISSFVEKGRLNVIKALFDRCSVRGATAELGSLLQALTTACGGNWKYLIPKLCLPAEPEAKVESESKDKKFQQPDAKNKTALLSHGSQLVSTLLALPGQPCKAIQNSLLSLSPDQLLHLSTSSASTGAIIVKVLATPPQIPHFHKLLVAALLPNMYELAVSQHSSAIVNAIIAAPSKGDSSVAIVPFYLKENIMAQLERHENDLRGSWLGRNVWRTWRGDLWSYRRHDWVRWAKETDPEGERVAAMPKLKVEEGKEARGGVKRVKPAKKNKDKKDKKEKKENKEKKEKKANADDGEKVKEKKKRKRDKENDEDVMDVDA